MAGAELAVGEHVAHVFGQVEQPRHIGDVTAAFADHLGDLFLGLAEIVGQPCIGLGLLDRRQLVALDVLDQGDRQRLFVGEIADDDRRFVDLRALCGAPAAFAGDDLERVGLAPRRADDQRLQDALFADRRGQVLQRVVVEMAARLQRIGDQLADRDQAESHTRRGGAVSASGT